MWLIRKETKTRLPWKKRGGMGKQGKESVDKIWMYPKSLHGYRAVTQSNPFCQSCQSSWKSACREPGSRCFISKEEVLLAFVPKVV